MDSANTFNATLILEPFEYNGDSNVYEDLDYGTSVVGQVFQGFFAAWIFLSNLILVLSILTEKIRRSRAHNIFIINLSVVSAIVGIIIFPFIIHSFAGKPWTFGQGLCRTWVVLDRILSTASAYIMLVIGSAKLGLLVNARRYSAFMGVPAICCLIIAPLVLSTIFEASILLSGFVTYVLPPDIARNFCYFQVVPGHQIGLTVTACIIPALFMIGISIAIMVFEFCKKLDRGSDEEMQYDRTRDSSISVVVVSAVFIVMWLPRNVMHVLLTMHPMRRYWYDFAFWMAYIRYGVIPLLWLISSDIRQGCVRLVTCGFRYQNRSMSSNVDTKNAPPVNAMVQA